MTTRLLAIVLLVVACRDRAPDPPPAPPPAAKPPPVAIDAAAADAPAPKSTALVLDFNADAVGGPPSGIEPVIGVWRIDEADGARGLAVDGTAWKGTSFPLAIAVQDPPPGDVKMSIKFYPIAGRIDQGAGIAFGIAPDRSYWGVRANALEGNILYFKVVNGKRTVIDEVGGTSTATHAWHTLVATLKGHDLDVELDTKHVFHKQLDTVPAGRVGLWSKADSHVLFDEFRVEPL